MLLAATSIDFDKLAEEVVSGFYDTGTPLKDLLVKVATRECLNPEEVKRLVERSNTSAVLHLLKVSSDKKAEIDLASPEEVVSVTHRSEPEVVKEAQVTNFNFAIPDLRSPKLELKYPELKKESSAKVKNASEIFRLAKKENELLNIKTATEMKIQDNLDYFVSEFSKRNSPDFSKFAADAFTVLGEASVPILEGLGAILQVKTSFEKTASVVDDTTLLFKKFAETIEQLKLLHSTNEQYSQVKVAAQAFWKEIKCQ